MNRRHNQRHATTYKPPFRSKNRRVSIINIRQPKESAQWWKAQNENTRREIARHSFVVTCENPWRCSLRCVWVTAWAFPKWKCSIRSKQRLVTTAEQLQRVERNFMNQLQFRRFFNAMAKQKTIKKHYRQFYHPRSTRKMPKRIILLPASREEKKTTEYVTSAAINSGSDSAFLARAMPIFCQLFFTLIRDQTWKGK